MDAPGKFRHIPINYDAIVSRESPEQDLVLKAGDTIYVP
jgi:polysaccharide export outer membrane protein